jgi:hypothetical protein
MASAYLPPGCALRFLGDQPYARVGRAWSCCAARLGDGALLLDRERRRSNMAWSASAAALPEGRRLQARLSSEVGAMAASRMASDLDLMRRGAATPQSPCSQPDAQQLIPALSRSCTAACAK